MYILEVAGCEFTQTPLGFLPVVLSLPKASTYSTVYRVYGGNTQLCFNSEIVIPQFEGSISQLHICKFGKKLHIRNLKFS